MLFWKGIERSQLNSWIILTWQREEGSLCLCGGGSRCLHYSEPSWKLLLVKIWESPILFHGMLYLLWYEIYCQVLTIEQNLCSWKKFPIYPSDSKLYFCGSGGWGSHVTSLASEASDWADQSLLRWQLLHWDNSVLKSRDQGACPEERSTYTAAVSLVSIPAPEH